MKKILIITLLTFVSLYNYAQTNSIVGKWKIVKFEGEGLYVHDYKLNKTTYNQAFVNQYKGKEDSTMQVGLASMIIPMLKDFEYVFLEDGKYKSLSEGEEKSNGTYTVNTTKGTIIIKQLERGKEYLQNLSYSFKENQLILVEYKNKKKITYTVEKQ